jgi:ectoine hydroxylase-related dioxygenase (phytanoyl-CoA dioxygenase family)
MKELCKNEKYELLKKYLLNNFKLKKEINRNLTCDYQLHDYIFIIKKSNIHTCHRDNNGSFYNKLQKYPSYTMIIYLENMESCLSIIPTSHISPQNRWWWNITKNPLENVLCNEGDVIIFDANTIHAGSLPMSSSSRLNNIRIQLKLSHRDDLNILFFYQKYNKMLNQENNMYLQLNKFQQNISCMFPIVSDLTQPEHKTKANGTNNKMLSFMLSGNNEFYNFTNIL